MLWVRQSDLVPGGAVLVVRIGPPCLLRFRLSDDEFHAVIEAAEVAIEDQALIVWLMVRCGMRIGEATALKRSGADFDEGTIRIERTLTRDGHESAVKGLNRADEGRTIPMSDDVERRVR